MKKLYILSACLMALAAKAQVTFEVEAAPYCGEEGCYQLYADFPALYQTNEYQVTPIPYSPSFPFTGGTVLAASGDDTWSPIFNLPFNFSFYGTVYNSVLVGSNGVITFDLVNQAPLGYCNWPFTATIPNTQFPIKNAIFGAYQDTNIASPPVVNPLLQNVNYYLLDTGANAAPNRVFVANFNELPQFQCNESVGLQTSQIVIHEGTNEIEIFINKRTSCVSWNSGSGLIGLLNLSGTSAAVPPGRNTGTWSATNEAWRFTPSGDGIPVSVAWSLNGVPFSNENPTMACPTEAGSYMATVTYSNSPVITLSNEVALEPLQNDLGVPVNLQVCGGPTYVVDLTVNTPIVLAAVNPNDYLVTYYNDPVAAFYQQSPIGNPSNYMFTQNDTMFIGLEDLNSGCYLHFPFTIEGFTAPAPPSGAATQTFTPGQTLANLVVTGQNIQWYDQPTGGNELPMNTLLVNNTTYYASQTVGGCESRMLNNRLPVTAMSALGVSQFTAAQVKLYPNPADQTLTVSLPQNIDRIEIVNMLGQTVVRNATSGKEVKVDVSNLAGGSYLIKIHSANESVTSKFIKK